MQYHKEGFFAALNGHFKELKKDYNNACQTYLDNSGVSTAGSLLLKAYGG